MRFRFALFFLLFAAISATANAQSYIGELILKPLPDGRNMKLMQDFGFKDAENRTWNVPSGWEVNGASIPWALWSIVGAPYSGKYREASVIHDYFCDVKRRPWDQVHQVFYDAMLASGVNNTQAKIMYAAVYRFGPRWDFSVPTCLPGSYCETFGMRHVEQYSPKFDKSEFEEITRRVEKDPAIELKELRKPLDAAFIKDAALNAN